MNNNPVNFIDPWGLYGEDVHYYRTKYWARQRGINPKIAETIANTNVNLDKGLSGPGNPFGGTGQHFRDRNSTIREMQDAIKRGNAKEFGEALHRFQDTFSHGGYHWAPGIGEWGHLGEENDPDIFDPNSKVDQWMEKETKEWLNKWEEREKSKCK